MQKRWLYQDNVTEELSKYIVVTTIQSHLIFQLDSCGGEESRIQDYEYLYQVMYIQRSLAPTLQITLHWYGPFCITESVSRNINEYLYIQRV